MAALGWGLDPYGTGVFGSAVAGEGVALAHALAISTHEVEVTLTAEPLHSSAATPGDALNPATWAVQRLDTTAFLHVISVAPTSPRSYVATVLEPLGPAAILHRISSSTLLDASGGLLRTPRHQDFYGTTEAAIATASARAITRKTDARDLFNSPALLDGEGGTLRVTSGGDYAEMSGAALVRKLILRRLTTAPGEFFHMPSYGVGLKGREPIRAGGMSALKTEIERQVLQEPEVAAAQASLLLDSSGVFTVTIKATLRKTGGSLDVTLPLRQAALEL
jgi:hypothetical protein